MAEQEFYTSRYYTSPEIDRRLLQGLYDDVVKRGYPRSKTEFESQLASMVSSKRSSDNEELKDPYISLITEALRKTPQILTETEKTQVRRNLDIPSVLDLTKEKARAEEAEQGLSDRIDKLVVSGGGGGTEVIDNLTSPSKTAALSANQGKVLNVRLTELENNVSFTNEGIYESLSDHSDRIEQNAEEINNIKEAISNSGGSGGSSVVTRTEFELVKNQTETNKSGIASLAEDVNAISGDISNLKQSDEDLSNEITQAENRLDERIDKVRDGLESEITRAKDAEQDLSYRIDNLVVNGGKDYIILKEDVSFAEQVTKANTIYEIRYDFDLNGAKATIPEGCVLKFNGGIIKNGSLVFNNTILEGTIEFDGIISIDGKVKNDTIESDNYGFVTDKEKLSFLFNQIRDNVTIIINGIYNVSYNDLVFTPTSKTFKSGRTIKTYSWKKFDTINNLKLVGNAVINFTNCPTTVYREVLYFSNGLNNSTIQLSATGDVNFYKVDNDYGLNLIKVMGDSNGNHIALTCDRLAIPFYFGDYWGNDGLTGLINSDITVVNSTDEGTNIGNKYGARIHYARNCNIFIKNSYGHRGLYLGGGISHCKIRTECKYMDTSAAVMIGNTYVNDRIQGANDLYIETHDTGTKGDNSIVPARVYINSHGGNIDNGISARDYSVIYDNIEIVATYSAETSSTTSIMPFIIQSQGTMDTGRNLVPKDIKKIKCTLILTDGAIVPATGSTVLNIYSTYDGRYDDIDLYYRIINNSSRSDIYASGIFGVNNNHKITIHSDVRVTPYMFRQSLPKSDWLITNEQYDGSYQLIFKDTPLYLPDYTQTQWETITGRNEAIPEYIIVEGKKAVSGASRIPQYNKNLTLFKSRGTTAERPAARNGDRYYDTTIQKFIYWDSARGGWINSDGYAAGNRSGARRTELTDSLTGLDTGLQFYDTLLGKLVIWNGDSWEGLDGSTVD